MLSYQHGFHAGCFADVVKHITLTRLLSYMTQKDKPYLYIETHAGRGLYDLKNKQAIKTGEFKQGIQLLWDTKEPLSSLFSPYLNTIRSINDTDELRFYPGSPILAQHLLRASDRLFLSELHPREYEALKKISKKGKRIFFHHGDGVHALSSILPPIERRGLIFIDPSYEIKEEYRTIIRALETAYKRFSTGVYCLWYPILDVYTHGQFIKRLQALKCPNALQIEFFLSPIEKQGMYGCGLFIINAPHVLYSEMSEILKKLCTILNPKISCYIIK